MKKLYEQMQSQIEKVNASYKVITNKHRKPSVFNVGDLAWFHPRNKFAQGDNINPWPVKMVLSTYFECE